MLPFTHHVLTIFDRFVNFFLRGWSKHGHCDVLWRFHCACLTKTLVEILIRPSSNSIHNTYRARALFRRSERSELHLLIRLCKLNLFFLRLELLVDVRKLFFEVLFINLILLNSLAKCKCSQSKIKYI